MSITINGSTGISGVDGSSTTPAFQGTDTNTGIFFSAADTIDFTEGGTTVGQFDSSANFKFNSGYGSVATAYGCRAWVNFNGTGTVAIRASGNVTSITDNGVGDYTVNFTTAMPDANYSVLATRATGTNSTTARIFGVYSAATVLVGSVRVYSYYYDSGGNSTQDIDFASVSIFR